MRAMMMDLFCASGHSRRMRGWQKNPKWSSDCFQTSARRLSFGALSSRIGRRSEPVRILSEFSHLFARQAHMDI